MSDVSPEERAFLRAIDTAISIRALTFSGWLRYVKKLAEEEISGLWRNDEKWRALEKEYLEWIEARDA